MSSRTFVPEDSEVPEAPAPPPSEFAKLQPVSRDAYEVLGEFARGGLGRVLRARDRRADRIVAVKEALRSSPALHARFAREAFVTAHLQHPAIVPVYEVGRWAEGGQPFYAMKLVSGASLDDALQRARSPADRMGLLPHAIAVADALAYAHGQGVIHRDLKPANVLIGDFGETVVIDWGLARRLDRADADPAQPDEQVDPASGRTLAGSVLGTPGYMAPEQARGDAVDERVDVWALGAMLYEVLGGVRPFAEVDGVGEIVNRTLAGPPRPLREIERTLPSELVTIVERAMAFDPADRYRTAREFADDLRRYQTGQLVGAHAYTVRQLVGRWLRRHRGVVIASTIAAGVLLATGALSVASIREARDTAVAAQGVAEERLVTLYTESARRLADDPGRALPYLAEALAAPNPEAAFLAGRAMEGFEAARHTLLGHVGPVLHVAWSPDGAELLTSGGDMLVGRWDARTGEKKWLRDIGTAAVFGPGVLYGLGATAHLTTWTPDGEVMRELPFATPEGGTDTARKLVVSPRGTYVAAYGQEGAVLWWRAATGEVVGKTRASSKRALSLAWAPDESSLLAGGDGGTVTRWAADGTVMGRWTAHEGSVETLDVEGAVAASGGSDGGVVLYDLASGATTRLEGHTGAVVDVAFSGDRLASAGLDGATRIWRLTPSPSLVGVAVGTSSPHLVAWVGEGLVTAGEDGGIDRWTGEGVHRGRMLGHTSAVAAIALSPDGTTLASASLDLHARTWDLGTRAPTVRLDVGTVASRGVLSAEGVLVTGQDGVARTFAMDGTPACTLRGHTAEVVSVAWSPTRVATGGADGTTRTWDPRTCEPLLELPAAGGKARWVGFSPDGTLLTSAEADGAARVRRADTGEGVATLVSSFRAIRSAPWSPDGARIVTPTEGPGATLWDARSFASLAELPVMANESYAVGWARDGARFLLTAGTPDVTLRSAADGALLKVFSGHALGPVAAAALSPDGLTALTAGVDGTARTWDVATGAQRAVVGDAATVILGAAFRPDGAVFVTAGGGPGVTAWSARTGQRLHTWTNVPERPAGVSFSPDGRSLLVVGLEGPPAIVRSGDWSEGAAALQRIVTCRVPWRLDAGVLVSSFPLSGMCGSE